MSSLLSEQNNLPSTRCFNSDKENTPNPVPKSSRKIQSTAQVLTYTEPLSPPTRSSNLLEPLRCNRKLVNKVGPAPPTNALTCTSSQDLIAQFLLESAQARTSDAHGYDFSLESCLSRLVTSQALTIWVACARSAHSSD